MRMLSTTALAIAMLVAATSGRAQSLGEVAEREKARRKKIPPTKVITEDELHGGRARAGTTSSPGAGGAGADGPESKPGVSDKAKPAETSEDADVRAQERDVWHQNLDNAEKEVAHYRGQVAAIQSDLNDLSGGAYGATRADLISRLDEGQKRLAAAEQKLAQLQDEGRRKGY